MTQETCQATKTMKNKIIESAPEILLAIGIKVKECRSKITYQSPFPETKKCRKCKVNAPLVFLYNDENKDICQARPAKAKIWPHDSMAIALYLCPECGNILSDWNQG